MTITHEEMNRWTTGNTMELTRVENLNRLLALIDERDRLKVELAVALGDHDRLPYEVQDRELSRLEGEVARLTSERDSLRADMKELFAYCDAAKKACGHFSYQGRPLPETCAEMLATIEASNE